MVVVAAVLRECETIRTRVHVRGTARVVSGEGRQMRSEREEKARKRDRHRRTEEEERECVSPNIQLPLPNHIHFLQEGEGLRFQSIIPLSFSSV